MSEAERSSQEWLAALDDPEQRAEAASALGKLQEPRAVKPLIRYLDDGQILVQMSAARALGEIGDAVAIVPLLEVTRDPNRNIGVRRVAANALERLGYATKLEADGPNALVFWAIGLGLVGGAVALASTIEAVAIVPFLAGLGLLVVYYLRERQAGRSRGYALADGGDPVLLDSGHDGGGGDGGFGDGGGGGNGGG